MSSKEKKVKNMEEKKSRKVLDIVFTSLQIVLTLVFVIISIVIIINPTSLAEEKEEVMKQSVKMMVVQTDSMAPTLEERDMIFGKKVDESVQKGETVLDLGTVITFPTQTYVRRNNGELVYVWIPNSHRVIGYAYTCLEGEETVNHYYYLKDSKVSWDSVKQEGWTFSKYITSGDKYTLQRKNFTPSGEQLYEKQADGSLKKLEYQNVEELNGDFRTFGYYEEDGKQVVDYNNVVLNPTSLKSVEQVNKEDVIGFWKGSKITFLGKMISWLREPSWHFGLIVVVPLLLLFGYNVFLIVRMIIADKQQKAVEEARKEVLTNEEEIKRKAIEEYLASLNNGPKEEEKAPLDEE